jgi:hypothetical protein
MTSSPHTRKPGVSWLYEHERAWSLAILALLLIAFAGPWSFDLINVPSEFACSAPFIRLKGDYCGVPLPGTWIALALVGEFVVTIGGLATGTMVATDLSRGLPVLLASSLLFLPLFSTLLRFLHRDRRRLQILHFVVWGMATVSIIWWFLLSPPEWPPSQLWGRSLYYGIALAMLVVEATLVTTRGGNRVT